MTSAMLEHVNFTVSDPVATANRLCGLFGWRVRWQGPAIDGGMSVHVGADDSYLALYTPGKGVDAKSNSYRMTGGLNHVGIVVDDLDAVEKKVIAAGLEPHSHADYEPGRRFYFHDEDGIEFEVVSYATVPA
ncbi:VOC family protein [Hoeflea poritis]|uniref:VOC family protein n=1 Tax=Hoeflea poritis TaxID=2993659 RepID=A0ABT4VTP5_9HYPH|nr:VOC family protein [Hoeflea poritis]MDA4848089.1 VOC family protein [Hoeflea poritis]